MTADVITWREARLKMGQIGVGSSFELPRDNVITRLGGKSSLVQFVYSSSSVLQRWKKLEVRLGKKKKNIRLLSSAQSRNGSLVSSLLTFPSSILIRVSWSSAPSRNGSLAYSLPTLS